jgi:formate dehydrogenase major subunit
VERAHRRREGRAEGKNWKTDLSGGIQRVVMKNHGCHPFGNAKARAVVWNFPDPMPLHREALYSTRPDLVDKYPTHDDKNAFWRLPTLYKSVQQKNRDIGKQFPLIMSSGRLVEYEGGGEETRSNPWLAELQQEMFVEINPAAANDRGIRDGEQVWVKSPTGAKILVRALVTERVDRARSGCRSTSRAAGRASTCCRTTPRARIRSSAAKRSTRRRPTATTA